MTFPTPWTKPADETCRITRAQLKMLFITYMYAAQKTHGEAYIHERLSFLSNFVNGLATALEGRAAKDLTREQAELQKADLLNPADIPNVIMTMSKTYENLVAANAVTPTPNDNINLAE
jgi:hypothetical protein